MYRACENLLADSIVDKLACRRITALVVGTSCFVATITFLSNLYNTITTHILGDGFDIPVAGKASTINAVPAHGRANIAYGAGTKCCHSFVC